jgi:hypothetical protein
VWVVECWVTDQVWRSGRAVVVEEVWGCSKEESSSFELASLRFRRADSGLREETPLAVARCKMGINYWYGLRSKEALTRLCQWLFVGPFLGLLSIVDVRSVCSWL